MPEITVRSSAGGNWAKIRTETLSGPSVADSSCSACGNARTLGADEVAEILKADGKNFARFLRASTSHTFAEAVLAELQRFHERR